MSGNGVDIAAVYQLLSQVAQTVARHDQLLLPMADTVTRLAETVARHDQVLGSIVSELHDMRRTMAGLATKAELADVRQALTQYHASVMGHGIMISELEDRVRRIEQHLSLT